MNYKKTKIMVLSEIIFITVKGSFVFLLSLIKSGIVYGWVDAFLYTSDYFLSDDLYSSSLFHALKRKVRYIPYKKTLSCMVTFSFSLGITGWLTLLLQYNWVSFLALYVGGLSFILWMIFLFFYIDSEEEDFLKCVYLTMMAIKDNFLRVLFLFLCIFIALWITFTKSLLGIVIFPGLLFYMFFMSKKVIALQKENDDLSQ